MIKNQLSLMVPIKIFDTDIILQDLINFISADEICRECLENNAFFIVLADNNDYLWFEPQYIAGNFIGFINEENTIKAKINIFTETPNGRICKELYDMFGNHFYITPHGMKEHGRITTIQNFTLWMSKNYIKLKNMELMTKGD